MDDDSDKSTLPLYRKEHLKYWTLYPDIEIVKKLSDNTFLIPIANRVDDRSQDEFQCINEFTTGICFDVPYEIRLVMIGTDKLLNQGYFLPHPVVVKSKDNNEVKIKLWKMADKDDLILPFHACLLGKIENSNYVHIRKIKKQSSSEINTINNTVKSYSESVTFY